MNIAYFLLPKANVACLYEDYTFRQGLEKMRRHGYTAIPVITRSGKYVGTVSEGDFLWHILDGDALHAAPAQNLEKMQLRDIVRKDKYLPARITATMEELLNSAVNQNFIPVVDDTDRFIGLITRRDILLFMSRERTPAALPLKQIV